MSEPKIFAEVMDDLRRDAQHGWDAFTKHIPHPHYHQTDSTATPATPATEAPPMSIVDDITTELHKATTEMHRWVDTFEQRAPALLADVAKLEQSPIFAALKGIAGTVLPPEIEASVVGLINMGAKMAGAAVTAVETPAAAPAADVPATSDVQTPAPVAG